MNVCSLKVQHTTFSCVFHEFPSWISPDQLSVQCSVSGSQEVNTRVMIFSSFRESVQEIASMLNRHIPLIRVMTFMGQASAGKGVKGFTQKEQLEVEVTVAQHILQTARLRSSTIHDCALNHVCVTLCVVLTVTQQCLNIPRK